MLLLKNLAKKESFLTLVMLLILFSCSETKTEKEGIDTEIVENPTDSNLNTSKKVPNNYSAVYHFGNSETESDLIIHGSEGNYFAQIKRGEFNDNATAFIWSYENLNTVKIEGNKFYSGKTNGEFLLDKDGKIKFKVEQSWSDSFEEDGSEIGSFLYKVEEYYTGDYNEASLKLLTKGDLNNRDKAELEVMRNEIFARYGYRFKEEGKMERYFKSKKWYQAQHKNVDNYLTSIEKENIELIQKAELLATYKEIDLKLEDFPMDWVGLTLQENGEYVIVKPCLTYNKGFNIKQKADGRVYFEVSTPFDSEHFDLADFKLSGSPIYETYKGRFNWVKTDSENKENISVSIVWNKLENYAIFEGIYDKPIRMVSDFNRNDYKIIIEECDENEVY